MADIDIAPAEQRAAAIQALESRKKSVDDLTGTYKAAIDANQKLADRVGDLLNKSTVSTAIEWTARMTGRSFWLSWVDLQTTVADALTQRVVAAEAASSRYKNAIDTAKQDLAGFRVSAKFADYIFDKRNFLSQSSDSASASPNRIRFELVEKRMQEDTQRAQNMAADLYKEAIESRNKAASAAAFQKMLSTAAAAAGFGAAVSAPGPTGVDTAPAAPAPAN
jgi:hypothetical protein